MDEHISNYNTETEWHQAPHTGERFANYFIDLILFYVVFFGISVLLSLVAIANGKELGAKNNTTDWLINLLFVYIVYFLYYFFSEGATGGRTVGKFCTRTKAVKLDGTNITWEDAFMRSLCRLIPFDFLSAFAGSMWHDEFSKTKVIKLR